MPADVRERPHLPVVAANDEHAFAEIFEGAPLARLRDLAFVAHHLRRRAKERLLLRLEEFGVEIEPARQAHILQRVRGRLDGLEVRGHQAVPCHFAAFAAMGAALARGMAHAPVVFRRQPEGRGIGPRQRSAKRGTTKNMPLYEHVFLARQDLAQAQVDALAENASKIIADNGGKIAKTETWGLRSLAYRIAKNRKAHYVMLDIDAPPAAIAELERQSNINEDIIRFLTIRVDEHEKRAHRR